MKYVIAFYNDLLHDPANRVPFGAVITDGKKVVYDFDTGSTKKNTIRDKSGAFDPLIFQEFKDTFEKNYIDAGVAYTTNDDGQVKSISVNSEEFLDYLSRNAQGSYQYSVPQTAEGNEPETVLGALMHRIKV